MIKYDYDYRHRDNPSVKQLVGKTLTAVYEQEDDEIIFKTDDGEVYIMWHHQDCCENVFLADRNGEYEDLIGAPILVAEERSSDPHEDSNEERYESETWTFYTFRTIKGSVDLRWVGTSNGYYSESVDFDYAKERKTKGT